MEKRIQQAIEDHEIRENIGYKFLLHDRLMVINGAFDSGDKQRIKSALGTTFDMLTPYINCRFRKCRCKKKLCNLNTITDKGDFILAAHEAYAVLLKIMHEHDMLFTEVPVALGCYHGN